MRSVLRYVFGNLGFIVRFDRWWYFIFIFILAIKKGNCAPDAKNAKINICSEPVGTTLRIAPWQWGATGFCIIGSKQFKSHTFRSLHRNLTNENFNYYKYSHGSHLHPSNLRTPPAPPWALQRTTWILSWTNDVCWFDLNSQNDTFSLYWMDIRLYSLRRSILALHAAAAERYSDEKPSKKNMSSY